MKTNELRRPTGEVLARWLGEGTLHLDHPIVGEVEYWLDDELINTFDGYPPKALPDKGDSE